jgi:hypothetical protein
MPEVLLCSCPALHYPFICPMPGAILEFILHRAMAWELFWEVPACNLVPFRRWSIPIAMVVGGRTTCPHSLCRYPCSHCLLYCHYSALCNQYVCYQALYDGVSLLSIFVTFSLECSPRCLLHIACALPGFLLPSYRWVPVLPVSSLHCVPCCTMPAFNWLNYILPGGRTLPDNTYHCFHACLGCDLNLWRFLRRIVYLLPKQKTYIFLYYCCGFFKIPLDRNLNVLLPFF